MKRRPCPRVAVAMLGASALVLAACSTGAQSDTVTPAPSPSATETVTPTGTAPSNVYANAGAGMLNAVTRKAKSLVYVPNSGSNTVDVIDPVSYRVVRTFRVGGQPQHIVPSWDLKTLWVNNNQGNSLTPINPGTGEPGPSVPVRDPYNLYFTPDGHHALVMAERYQRIDVRDPRTMNLRRSIKVPCSGVNHADFSADGQVAVASCEFSGQLIVLRAPFTRISSVIDLNQHLTPNQPTGGMLSTMSHGTLVRGASAMPQDVRLTPDGRYFVVADMIRGGTWVIDASSLGYVRFVTTGRGAHGVYPSRDGSEMYVTNRDAGSITVLDASRLQRKATWRLPGPASPDMGGVTADGRQLWLSGRYDSVVYVISTTDGRLLHKIPVGSEPHGLAVWPQPGLYSLGHTGNMR